MEDSVPVAEPKQQDLEEQIRETLCNRILSLVKDRAGPEYVKPLFECYEIMFGKYTPNSTVGTLKEYGNPGGYASVTDNNTYKRFSS